MFVQINILGASQNTKKPQNQMKNILLTILLSISFNFVLSQTIEFKVQFSENYATFEFLRYLSEESPQNAFKEVFNKSQYNVPEYQDLIKQFNNLNYFYWYEYEQYPYGNKIGGNTYFILGRNLIESKTLEEFKTKSYGIIPNSDLNIFYSILNQFLPIYREIIYEPTKEKFNNQLVQIKALINRTDMNMLFLQALNFHQSTWDFKIPFFVSLCPIPDSRAKGFTATAFYNQAVSAIPQGLDNFEFLLSVMFHEAFHILYDEQSLNVKQNIAKWFESHQSNSSRYAQLLFNEAITTTLANGHLYKNIKGELLKSPWYNNEYISKMGEALFPMVKEYINAKKPMDELFVKNYIDLFDERFPDWLKDINHLMMQRFVISESKESYRTLYKKYRYANIREYKNELNVLSLEKMKTHPVTKVIIVTNDNESKLKLIKNNFNELKDWNPNYQKDFSHSQFLSDKTYLIIINSKSEDITNLLENITIK